MNSQHNQSMTEMVQTIGKLAVARQQLARQAEQQYCFEVEAASFKNCKGTNIAEQQYCFEVEAILRDQCRDPQHIERLLDGMLDFCFDDEMVRLYKKLCRYYFKIDPVATASYVYAYREMWDEEED